MFERYTEAARRVLFFARYEASQLGSRSIETEHLLLGLIRDGKGHAAQILSRLSLENLRAEIERRSVFHEKVSTSVEIPFSVETKHVLQFTAEEADRLRHGHIGTEHLLLALLRQETSVAGSILLAHGLRLDDIRREVESFPVEPSAASPLSPRALQALGQIEQIKRLVEQLARTPADCDDARDLVERISQHLDALKRHFGA
jgi:ATP-dependent Clp protease ATP-binding subunit ClpC